MAIEIVDFPIKNCDFPSFFVGLPEGTSAKNGPKIPWENFAEPLRPWEPRSSHHPSPPALRRQGPRGTAELEP
jgi:hypothetical protein